MEISRQYRDPSAFAGGLGAAAERKPGLWRWGCWWGHTVCPVDVSVDSKSAAGESLWYGSCEFARRRPWVDTVARIEDASCYGWCKLAAACGHALVASGWIQLLFGHETGQWLDCLLGCQGSS